MISNTGLSLFSLSNNWWKPSNLYDWNHGNRECKKCTGDHSMFGCFWISLFYGLRSSKKLQTPVFWMTQGLISSCIPAAISAALAALLAECEVKFALLPMQVSSVSQHARKVARAGIFSAKRLTFGWRRTSWGTIYDLRLETVSAGWRLWDFNSHHGSVDSLWISICTCWILLNLFDTVCTFHVGTMRSIPLNFKWLLPGKMYKPWPEGFPLAISTCCNERSCVDDDPGRFTCFEQNNTLRVAA
jgi:hypothetical protein